MTTDQDDYELLRSYLLRPLPTETGETGEAGQPGQAETAEDRLERRLLAEGDLFALAGPVEDELLDDYAEGNLTPPEQKAVLARLASSQAGRERLANSRAFVAVREKEKEGTPVIPFPQRPVAPSVPDAPPVPSRRRGRVSRVGTLRWSTAAAAAALVIVGGGAWWIQQGSLLGSREETHIAAATEPAAAVAPQRPAPVAPAPVTPQPAVQEPVRPPAPQPARPVGPAQPAQPAQPEPSARPGKPVPLPVQVVALALAVERGGSVPEAPLLVELARAVELRVDLGGPDPSPRFRVTLRGAGGVVWEWEDLEATDEGMTLALPLKAGLLKPGRYEIAIEGGTGGGSYEEPIGGREFDVEKP